MNVLPARVPIIGGNWKMNTTAPEAAALATDLAGLLGDTRGVEIVVFPPFTNIAAVSATLHGDSIDVGAQDVFWEDSGAFTGEISPPMLASVGAAWVIVGHSERRHLLGESSEVVNRKTRRALESGLSVILAIGESGEERAAGHTEAVLTSQLTASLDGIEPQAMAAVVLAYEPVWAIGTGLTATPEQVQAAHAFIRGWLAEFLGEDVAAHTRIQYGGSVTSGNAASLLPLPDVDGALVGGASLKPDDFATIVRAAAPTDGDSVS